MSAKIHPSAVVEDGARIGEGSVVGPFCLVGPDVVLGRDVILHSHVVVTGHTEIGDGTQVYPFASLGHAPQDLKFRGEKSRLVIGRNNVIREHATMNPGTETGAMKTVVGDNGLFMIGSHIAHDCVVGNHVILANNASLAGHVTVGDYAILGGLVGVHQFVRIGAHAVIGGVTGVDNDVIPYGRVKGERGHLAGLNLIGLERRGFGKDQIRTLQRALARLFDDEGTMEDRLAAVEREFGGEDVVMEMVRFARDKTRFPLCAPPRKAA